MASSSIRNRTAEFHSAIDSMLSRTAGNGSVSRSNAAERSRLVMRDTATPSSSSASPTSSRSEFARKAALINREIVGMSNSLHRLAQLARKKSLFDDQPAEIGRLIAVVKAKIPEISRLIGELADARKGQAPGAAAASTSSSSSSSSSSPSAAAALARNRQVDEHSSNVITSLQAKLATSSSKFKSILEVRTQAMRDQKSRRDQYSMSPAPSALPVVAGAGPSAATTASTAASSGIAGSGPLARPAVGSVMASLAAVGPRTSLSAVPPSMAHSSSSSAAVTAAHSLFAPVVAAQSPLYNPEGGLRSRSAPGVVADDVVVEFGSSSSQQQQLMYAGAATANMEYIESRAAAIESIESTIAELGQIYSHFAQILAGQRETIQRIDDNIVDVEMNVSGAHNELVRYFQNMSSNRWLMVRVFAILIVFFLLFVLIS